MTRETVVVTKSTVPVGTASRVAECLSKHARFPFHVVSNPEFLKEGAALDDFMKPDRVVLGADTDHARSVMAELYAPFVRTGKPIIFMDVPSAELTKYAANAMLATRISFMNDIANLCETRRRQRRRRAEGNRFRRANRSGVSLPRAGLRRLLLPQGRQGAGKVGARSVESASDPRSGGGGQ